MADDIARINEFKLELAAVKEANSQLVSEKEKLVAEKDKHAKRVDEYENAKKRDEEVKRKINQHITNFIRDQRAEVESLKQEHIEHKKTADQITKTVANELTNQMDTMVSSMEKEHVAKVNSLKKQLVVSTEKVTSLVEEKSTIESEL